MRLHALQAIQSFLNDYASAAWRRLLQEGQMEALSALIEQVRGLQGTMAAGQAAGRLSEAEAHALDAVELAFLAWRQGNDVTATPWVLQPLGARFPAALELMRAGLLMAGRGDLVASERPRPAADGISKPFVLGVDGFAPWLGVAVGACILDQLGGTLAAPRGPIEVMLTQDFRQVALASREDESLVLATLALGEMDGRARRRLWEGTYHRLMGRPAHADRAAANDDERARHLRFAREVEAVAWRRNTPVLKEVMPVVAGELARELAAR